MNEQEILKAINFPFIVWMEFTFEDKNNLYFIMPLALGGELFRYIGSVGFLKEEAARFYASQVVLVFEYLHYLDVMYRDLKPENILIDHYGYIKVSDLGFSKIASRTYTLCGTVEYLAPEIIQLRGYGKGVDWWALGVFIYELLAGYSPFVGSTPSKTYDNILTATYKFPKHFTHDAISIIGHLLQPDLTKRFGLLNNGVADIKKHAWFENISWLDLLGRNIKPPYVPHLKNVYDTTYFEKSAKKAPK